MATPILKAVIDYTNVDPFHLSENLSLAGTGVASDPLFIDAPENGVVLKAKGAAILTTHEAAQSGDEGAQAEFEAAFAAGQESMHNFGVYANFKCAGVRALLIKIKVPFYDASTSGRPDSTFSLVNAQASGELIITVPSVSRNDSYIAIYSIDPEALVADYKVAGGNKHCKFSLYNMPAGTKIWVRWAIINAMGIGAFSEPYPIIVT